MAAISVTVNKVEISALFIVISLPPASLKVACFLIATYILPLTSTVESTSNRIALSVVMSNISPLMPYRAKCEYNKLKSKSSFYYNFSIHIHLLSDRKHQIF